MSGVDPNNPRGLVEVNSLKIVSFKWMPLDIYVYVAFVILYTTLLRIVQKNVKIFRDNFPESCFMMSGGMLFEAVRALFDLGGDHWPQLTSNTLFWIIIPSCMINCSMQMYNRQFFNNIFSTLSLAVLGTLINIICISALLWLIQRSGVFAPQIFSLHEIALFASAISAVDPIGVLTIFDSIGIHKDIYFILFGESVLNDAAVCTIFNIVSDLKAMDQFQFMDALWMLVAFFLNSFGPILIGSLYALIAILISKYTTYAVAAEPVILLLSAYLSYMTSETLRFSSIMAIVTNMMLIEQYAVCNIARNSKISLKLIAETLSTSSEGVKFYFLGTLLFRGTFRSWNTEFVLSTFTVCAVVRFLGNFFLFFISNRVFKRMRPISWKEQILVSWSGLRSGISYVLCTNIPDQHHNKSHIISAALFNIFVTGLIMTPTVKLLVKLFKIPTDNRLWTNQRNAPVLVAINARTMNLVTMAIEEITQIRSTNNYMEKLHRFSERYLNPYLLKNPTTLNKRQILESYERSCKNAINHPGTRIDWLRCTHKTQTNNQLKSVKVNASHSLSHAFKWNLYKSISNRRVHCKSSNNRVSFSDDLNNSVRRRSAEHSNGLNTNQIPEHRINPDSH